MESPEPGHILFVVGMHRSGTSALCAALQACGAKFGDDLLRPMRDVNDQGFWESTAVVEINDRLLELTQSSWYAADSSVLQVDWAAPVFNEEREAARVLLQPDINSGPLEVIKDPRLCLTLPFWIALCKEIGVGVSVCTMWREPGEICKSLEQRDGFPPGHCMRLVQIYYEGIASAKAPQVLSASYDALLSQPVKLLTDLSRYLPLRIDEGKLEEALLPSLRHHSTGRASENLEHDVTCAKFEFPSPELNYQVDKVVRDFAVRFVDRGRELTRIGESHSLALDTIQKRDRQLAKTSMQIERLQLQIGQHEADIAMHYEALENAHEESHRIGRLHTETLATISTRDSQISELDARLSEIGAQHSKALETIQERDAQLQELGQDYSDLSASHSVVMEEYAQLRRRLGKFAEIPVIGRIIRVIWNRA